MFHVKHFALRMHPSQHAKLLAYAGLLKAYNQKLNLLSRQTTEEGFIGHIRESLILASFSFSKESIVADWGTGGGLPAIPFAIMHPRVQIYAIDSVHKKVLAVKAFKRELELPNLTPWHGRAEEFSVRIHHSLSRGVASLSTLWSWHSQVACSGGTLYCLKGGVLKAEQATLFREFPSAKTTLIPVPDTPRVVVQVCADVSEVETPPEK